MYKDSTIKKIINKNYKVMPKRIEFSEVKKDQFILIVYIPSCGPYRYFAIAKVISNEKEIIKVIEFSTISTDGSIAINNIKNEFQLGTCYTKKTLRKTKYYLLISERGGEENLLTDIMLLDEVYLKDMANFQINQYKNEIIPSFPSQVRTLRRQMKSLGLLS